MSGGLAPMCNMALLDIIPPTDNLTNFHFCSLYPFHQTSKVVILFLIYYNGNWEIDCRDFLNAATKEPFPPA